MSAQPDRTVATHRSARTSRVTRAIGVAAASALLTAGCAAGQVAQTAYQRASIDGINRSVGTMDLRGVAIESPPGQLPFYRPGTAAPLTVVFVNNARSADQLTSIKTSAASGYAYFRDYNDAFKVEQAAGAAVTGAPAPSSTAPSSASSSPSAPSSSSSAATLPTGEQSITIPAGGRVSIATPESAASILLTGVSKALYPANVVNVTFTFTNAGTVTVPVPVQVATLGRAAEVPGGNASAAG